MKHRKLPGDERRVSFRFVNTSLSAYRNPLRRSVGYDGCDRYIVNEARRNNPSPASQELPLHKGAFGSSMSESRWYHVF